MFSFNDKDDFDLVEVLIKLLTQFKESYTPADTATTADDLAKFLVRWQDHLATLSKEERDKEVKRVLEQMALDKASLQASIEASLKHHQELVKRDMRFYLFLSSIVVSVLLLLDIKYGVGISEMLKNMSSSMPPKP